MPRTREFKIKHTKPKPILKKDVSELINNLLRYQSANKECSPTLDGVGSLFGNSKTKQLQQQIEVKRSQP